MWKRIDNTDPNNCLEVGWLFLIVVIISFAMTACCPQVYGGWGSQGCPSVGGPAFAPAVVFQAVIPLTWHYPDGWEDTGGASLYRGNQLVGSYNYATGIYTPADGTPAYSPEGWPVWRVQTVKDGCKCKKCDGKCKCGKGKCCGDKGCKCCCPSDEEVVLAQLQIEQNFGLELDKIGTSGSPRHTLHDGPITRELTREETKRLLSKGLGDDSNKPYLVAVCSDPVLREKVYNDFYSSSAFVWARENVRMQVYGDPKHYHLDAFKLDQDQRFQKSGLMIAVLQAPNKEGFGKRLYAQYDYDGGGERLSTEARRRIDPNWDPNKLPGPVNPDITPNVSAWVLIGQLFAVLPGWSWILASLGVALLILRGAK